MMRQKYIFEFDGKTYMSAKVAADKWGLSVKTIYKYCQEGKIKAEKDGCGHWCIPIEAIKPLSENEIYKLLLLTLHLKNNPKIEINWIKNLNEKSIWDVYTYLYNCGYIESFDDEKDVYKIPYKVVLSQKGLFLVFSKKQKQDKVNFCDILKSVYEIFSIFIDLASIIA